ncbi:MAG: hypothetical protein SR1Q5_09275 [Quinella sp. 1Q5]|nr:hypothetical protein [Quinella sp. 1Q5]
MFEDGAKLDDILDVLKRPPMIGNKNKQPVTEAGFRYDSGKATHDNVQLDLGQKTLEVLK